MLFILQKPISWKNYRKQVSLVHFELKTIQIFITAYNTKLNHNVVTYEMKYFSVTLSRFNFMFLVQFFCYVKLIPLKPKIQVIFRARIRIHGLLEASFQLIS